jgi:TIR domain
MTADMGEAIISYSHKNMAVAVAVQAELEAQGWRTFRDETSIEIGDSLAPELADAIDRADLFVAVVSSDYVASKVCMLELTQAVDRKFTDDPGRLVPLKLGTVKMPKILNGVKYVKVAAGEEAAAVDAVLRNRRFADQVTSAARPVGESVSTPTVAPAGGLEAGVEVARVAVRYARELETLAEIG